MSHNGWKNYETWLVALHLSNDEAADQEVLDMAREAVDVNDLALNIRNFVDENNPLSETYGLYTDLLTAALNEVNWEEIAQSALSSVADEYEDEED